MNVALLNVRITIQQNTPGADSIGNRLARWENYYSCAATLSNESGDEKQDAGLIVDDAQTNFSIRWCRAISIINNTEYRVIFNGDVYNILAVDHMNYRRKSIKLRCQKARR